LKNSSTKKNSRYNKNTNMNTTIAIRTANPAGETDIAVQGPNNELIYYSAAPGSTWNSTIIAPAGTTYSTPALAVRTNGEADIVAQGQNNNLVYYHAVPGSGWSANVIAPAGTAFSAPAIAIRSDGLADIVVQGSNNQLLLLTASPGSGWASSVIAPAGTTFSAPAIAIDAGGIAHVAVQGPNNQLIYYSLSRGVVWSQGNPAFNYRWLGTIVGQAGTTFSAPSIAIRQANPAGEVDIVAQGPNNQLFYYHLNPGSTWSSNVVALASTTFSAPAIAVRSQNPAGEADIVVQGPNNSLIYYYATPGSGWSHSVIAAAGLSLAAPAVAVNSDGTVNVVAQAPNNQLLCYQAKPGTPWQSTSVTPPPPPTSRTWSDHVTFSGGTALGGPIKLVIDNTGAFWFSGQMHDSGFDPYSFTLVVVIVTPAGLPYAFGITGHCAGHDPFSTGSVDFDWNGTPTGAFKDQNGNPIPNPNPVLSANWNQIVQGSMGWQITAQDLTAAALSDFVAATVEKVLQDLASKGAQAALVALFA